MNSSVLLPYTPSKVEDIAFSDFYCFVYDNTGFRVFYYIALGQVLERKIIV